MEAGKRVSKVQRGVTLIECCIAVVVMSILVGSAAPSFEKFVSRRTLEGTAAEAAADLHFARSEAVSRNRPVTVSFAAAPDGARCVIVHSGTASSCSCAAGGIPQCNASAQILKSQGFAAGSKIKVASNVGSMTVNPVRGTFTLGGKVQVTHADGTELRHVVTPAGRIRTCAVDAKVSGYQPC